MTSLPHDPAARRRRTNVTVNEDLLQQAKALGIGLSAALEAKLVELVQEARRKQWLERNAAAIDAANAFLERHGLPLEEHRQF